MVPNPLDSFQLDYELGPFTSAVGRCVDGSGDRMSQGGAAQDLSQRRRGVKDSCSGPASITSTWCRARAPLPLGRANQVLPEPVPVVTSVLRGRCRTEAQESLLLVEIGREGQGHRDIGPLAQPLAVGQKAIDQPPKARRGGQQVWADPLLHARRDPSAANGSEPCIPPI